MRCVFCYVRGDVWTDAVMNIQGLSVCGNDAHVEASVHGLANGIKFLNDKYGETE